MARQFQYQQTAEPLIEVGTTFYLPSSGAAAISPAFDAGWETTSDADRLAMVTTKIASAMTSKTLTTPAAAQQTLFRQYVSAPLAAQEWLSTSRVVFYARTSEANAALNAVQGFSLRVVSNDGSTVRGTIRATLAGGGTEWHTSLRNLKFADSESSIAVTILDGDRIVLEVGASHAAVSSSASISFGDDSATDLPRDETETNPYNPVLFLGQQLVFQEAAAADVFPDMYWRQAERPRRRHAQHARGMGRGIGPEGRRHRQTQGVGDRIPGGQRTWCRPRPDRK